MYLFVFIWYNPYVVLFIYLSIFLWFYSFICSFIYWFAYLFICLLVYLFMYLLLVYIYIFMLSIYLSMYLCMYIYICIYLFKMYYVLFWYTFLWCSFLYNSIFYGFISVLHFWFIIFHDIRYHTLLSYLIMFHWFYTFSFQQPLQKSNIDTKNYHFEGTYLFPNHDFGYPGYPAVSFQGCRWFWPFVCWKSAGTQTKLQLPTIHFQVSNEKTLVV